MEDDYLSYLLLLPNVLFAISYHITLILILQMIHHDTFVRFPLSLELQHQVCSIIN